MKHISWRSMATALFLLPFAVSAQTPGTGRVHIKNIQAYSGASPLTKPTAIVVYDFASSPEEVALNKSVLSRVRTRVARNQEDEQAKIAHRVVDSFSESLVSDLRKTGIPVSRGVSGELPPDGVLAIHGDFQTIDEGNRTRRMAVGLGSGASKVAAHVECYLSQPSGNTVITEFEASSQSSRKPGAAETMGAGAAPEVAAAAGGVTEMKQNAEGDTGRMAKAVAKEISKTLKAHGWVEDAK